MARLPIALVAYRKGSVEQRGCTYEQFLDIYSQEVRAKALGLPNYRRPLGAYQRHRQNAKLRDIHWGFTLWTWWRVWQKSGRWDQRGTGDGFVMCRRGDVGPYSPSNVFIATATQNLSEGNGRRDEGGLPIGVCRSASGRYFATFRHTHLGTYSTIEAAAEAYARARNFTPDLLVRT